MGPAETFHDAEAFLEHVLAEATIEALKLASDWQVWATFDPKNDYWDWFFMSPKERLLFYHEGVRSFTWPVEDFANDPDMLLVGEL